MEQPPGGWAPTLEYPHSNILIHVYSTNVYMSDYTQFVATNSTCFRKALYSSESLLSEILLLHALILITSKFRIVNDEELDGQGLAMGCHKHVRGITSPRR